VSDVSGQALNEVSKQAKKKKITCFVKESGCNYSGHTDKYMGFEER
jgi:hypothetical protein